MVVLRLRLCVYVCVYVGVVALVSLKHHERANAHYVYQKHNNIKTKETMNERMLNSYSFYKHSVTCSIRRENSVSFVFSSLCS